MRHEPHVAPPAHPVPGRRAPRWRAVGQGHPVHRLPVRGGRGQQRRLEGQDGRALGAGGFGEDDHAVIPVERPPDACQRGDHVPLPRAVDEDRTPQSGHEPPEGPPSHPCLGHEHQWHNRGKHRDVQVGEVVGDDQHALRRNLALGDHAYAGRAHHPAPPAVHRPSPRLRAPDGTGTGPNQRRQPGGQHEADDRGGPDPDHQDPGPYARPLPQPRGRGDGGRFRPTGRSCDRHGSPADGRPARPGSRWSGIPCPPREDHRSWPRG